MDYAVPASKIAPLSSGEFVGIVADNPEERIRLKMFHCEIQNDHKAIAQEMEGYLQIPRPREVSYGDIVENYMMIKNEVEALLEEECAKILARGEGRSSLEEKEDGKDGTRVGDGDQEQLVSI